MREMELDEFLDQMSTGKPLEAGSRAHRFMHSAAQEALRITAQLNTGYHTADEVRRLLEELTGRASTSRSPSSRRSTASSART